MFKKSQCIVEDFLYYTIVYYSDDSLYDNTTDEL